MYLLPFSLFTMFYMGAYVRPATFEICVDTQFLAHTLDIMRCLVTLPSAPYLFVASCPLSPSHAGMFGVIACSVFIANFAQIGLFTYSGEKMSARLRLGVSGIPHLTSVTIEHGCD